MDVSSSLNDLVTARRLMTIAKDLEAERSGKKAAHKSAKERMEEDEAILSGAQPDETSTGQKQPGQPVLSEVSVKLADLARQLDDINAGKTPHAPNAAQPAGVTAAAAEITIQQQETVELSMRYTSLPVIDGLMLRSKNLAETDRYAFEFSDGSTFRIIDKWSGRSTRIWGDPHVDTDDQEGDRNGEFSDLKESNSHTTLMLQDGTRLTFTAKDNGVIEKVDIFNGSQHLGGMGAGSEKFNEKTGLFAGRVDQASSAGLPQGDVLYAGGDGNDWFSSSGALVWGKTTGSVVTSRPASILEISYRRSVTQSVSMATVAVKA